MYRSCPARFPVICCHQCRVHFRLHGESRYEVNHSREAVEPSIGPRRCSETVPFKSVEYSKGVFLNVKLASLFTM
jgi:hypothetical protein